MYLGADSQRRENGRKLKKYLYLLSACVHHEVRWPHPERIVQRMSLAKEEASHVLWCAR